MSDDPATGPQGTGAAKPLLRPAEKPRTDKEMRAERLAEALRANLKRRKQAARARDASADAGKS
ncbi:MAG: hypothetical protein P4L82_16510 [Ancalomicrobiaceae bacterium]|nr:hypothetical protein [Ancalomicrobiaceae bacterium]